MSKIKCKECGEIIEDEFDIRYINRYINPGMMQKSKRVCACCVESLESNGKVIRCESCGALWSADVLHDEKLDDTHTFTPCPQCHCDVVDGTTREEALAEAEAKTYAPTFRCEIEAQTPLDVLRLMQRVHYGLNKGQKDGKINDQGRVVGRWQFNEGGV